MEFTRSEGLCLVVGENKVLQVDVRLNIAPAICGALKVAADQVCTAAMHKPNDNLETRQAGRQAGGWQEALKRAICCVEFWTNHAPIRPWLSSSSH